MPDGSRFNTPRIYPTEEGHRDYDRNMGLAEKIADYWAARGYSVRIEIVNEGFVQVFRCAVHGIRSDMVNGYPTRKLKGAA